MDELVILIASPNTSFTARRRRWLDPPHTTMAGQREKHQQKKSTHPEANPLIERDFAEAVALTVPLPW
jgi:hypothetical protein